MSETKRTIEAIVFAQGQALLGIAEAAERLIGLIDAGTYLLDADLQRAEWEHIAAIARHPRPEHLVPPADGVVTYEVWRTHMRGAPDVRVVGECDAKKARRELALCYVDKDNAYPDAPIEFFIARVTRERLTDTEPTPDAPPHPASRESEQAAAGAGS